MMNQAIEISLIQNLQNPWRSRFQVGWQAFQYLQKTEMKRG
jgi:hypothetical protein